MAEGDGTQNLSNQQSEKGDESLGWRAQLPDTMKNNEAFTSFKTVGDFGKSYLETGNKLKEAETKATTLEGKVKEFEGKIGKELVPVLREGASEEETKSFFKALGVPEKADGYAFAATDIPEELKGRAEIAPLEAWAKGTFHKYNLTPAQAAGMRKEYYSMIAEGEKQLALKKEQDRQSGMEDLKKTWGDKYDESVALVGREVERVEKIVPGFKKFADESGLGNSPILVKVFHEYAKSMVGDEMVRGRPPGGGEQRTPGVLRYPSMEGK
jgi:hypothetical protein